MTRTLSSVALAVQLAGLFWAVAGLVLALVSGSGTDMSIGGPAVVVGLLDVSAIRAHRGSISISAALLGALVAVLLPLLIFVSGGPVEIVRLVDPNLAYAVLAWSSVPSVMGAILRRLAR